MSKMDWREKLFGKNIVNCNSPGSADGKFETVSTLEALSDCQLEGDGVVLGIYFSFANISEASDDFPIRLEEVYCKVKPRLKVVQVVLWAHGGTPAGLAEREMGFRKSLTGKPWFAVPFHDVDTKRRLTQKYSIAVGVPALVVRGRHVRDALLGDPKAEHFPWPLALITDRRLTQKYSIAVGVPALVVRGRHVRDALLGDPKAEHFPWPLALITDRRLTQKYSIAVGVPALVVRGRHVRDALLGDPKAEHFPWPPPLVTDVLKSVPLQRCGESADSVLYSDLPSDAVRIFYFAAHWCPPCRAFTPSVCSTLAAVRKRRAKHARAQLVLVSSDRSEESYRRTVSSVTAAGALSVPWSAVEARRCLASALGVAGIPALVLLDGQNRVLTERGRAALAGDPDGLNFPWASRVVTVLTDQSLLKMAQHPAVVLFIDDEDSELEFAESVLTPAAESYYEECSIQYPGFCPCQTSSDDENIDFDYPTSRSTSRFKRKPFKHTMFYIGVDGTDSADMLREHIGLDDAVPLLTAIDFPKQRMVTMKYGDEITTDSVQNFVDTYLSGNAEFGPIKPYSEKC